MSSVPRPHTLELLEPLAALIPPPRLHRPCALVRNRARETLVKSGAVVPAKAGTQANQAFLDPHLRGDDT